MQQYTQRKLSITTEPNSNAGLQAPAYSESISVAISYFSIPATFSFKYIGYDLCIKSSVKVWEDIDNGSEC